MSPLPSPRPFRAAARLVDFMRQADEPGLINLAAGVPSLEALPVAPLEQAMQTAMAAEGAAMFAYHHPEGDHALRALVAERLRTRGAAVTGPQLLTTTGCTQGLQVMLSVLLQPGDIVACEAPAYYGMLELLSEAGAQVLPLPLAGDEGIDLPIAEELLTRWRPKCLVVCSSLSNPSGATIPEAHREQLVQLCRRLGIRILEDDIYAELVEGGAPRPMLAFDDGSTVSYVTSFSKTVAPGLRVGICAPGTLFEEAAARKCQHDLHSSVVSEVALRYFFAAGQLDPHLARLHERNARRRALAQAAVARTFPAGTRLSAPRGGYMLWAELPGLLDLAALRERARAARIVFAAGPVFQCVPAPTTSLRLNCDKATEGDLVQGLETLGHLATELLSDAHASHPSPASHASQS